MQEIYKPKLTLFARLQVGDTQRDIPIQSAKEASRLQNKIANLIKMRSEAMATIERVDSMIVSLCNGEALPIETVAIKLPKIPKPAKIKTPKSLSPSQEEMPDQIGCCSPDCTNLFTPTNQQWACRGQGKKVYCPTCTLATSRKRDQPESQTEAQQEIECSNPKCPEKFIPTPRQVELIRQGKKTYHSVDCREAFRYQQARDKQASRRLLLRPAAEPTRPLPTMADDQSAVDEPVRTTLSQAIAENHISTHIQAELNRPLESESSESQDPTGEEEIKSDFTNHVNAFFEESACTVKSSAIAPTKPIQTGRLIKVKTGCGHYTEIPQGSTPPEWCEAAQCQRSKKDLDRKTPKDKYGQVLIKLPYAGK